MIPAGHTYRCILHEYAESDRTVVVVASSIEQAVRACRSHWPDHEAMSVVRTDEIVVVAEAEPDPCA